MKLPFKKEEFLGNVRSGKRRENNSPCNTEYFNVYHDSYTSEYAIELFESIYKEKTSALRIIPIMNILINNEIYLKDIKCRGETGKTAKRLLKKNEIEEGICNPEECEYYQKGKCSRTGKLYFRIVGIEDKGIWCYSTKSSGIDFIEKYLNLMLEKNIDITKNEFLLTLNEKQGKSGKVYVPDIKLVKEKLKNTPTSKGEIQGNDEKDSINKSETSSPNKIENIYRYIEGKMIDYKSQRVPRLVFVDNKGKQYIFFLTKTSKRDILHIGIGSEVKIIKVLTNKEKEMFLMDYDVVKTVEKTKKAV